MGEERREEGHEDQLPAFTPKWRRLSSLKDIDVASPHSGRLKRPFLPSSNGELKKKKPKTKTFPPWPVWLSWLEYHPVAERLQIRFPVRAHA